MQYVLTQEELDALKRRAEAASHVPSVPKLQRFCSMVADTLPVTKGWYAGKPWGCILTTRKNDDWYCDDCPAREVCPFPNKGYSQ